MNNSYNPNFYESRRMIEYVGRLITTAVAVEDLKVMQLVELTADGVQKSTAESTNIYGCVITASDHTGKLEYHKGEAVPLAIDLHGLLCKMDNGIQKGQQIGYSFSKNKFTTTNPDIMLEYLVGEVRKDGNDTYAIFVKALKIIEEVK